MYIIEIKETNKPKQVLQFASLSKAYEVIQKNISVIVSNLLNNASAKKVNIVLHNDDYIFFETTLKRN